jgi:hypothetical protein
MMHPFLNIFIHTMLSQRPAVPLQVRNAANVIVQPEYGDDGMDPVCMEAKNGDPVALKQKMSIVKALSPKAHSAEHAPLPAAFRLVVQEELAAMAKMPASNGAAQFSSTAFADSLQAFLDDKVG